MRIFMFMGLPYQGKTTAAHTLIQLLEKHPRYRDREFGYISTDNCRSEIRQWYGTSKPYDYSEREEKDAWELFLHKMMSFLALAPTNSVLILDGTFTSWSKIVDVFDVLTMNIDSYASQRLPLVIDLIHIGSQFGEDIWRPTDLALATNPSVAERWNERCTNNRRNGLTPEIPEEVFHKKFLEMQSTLSLLVSICKKYTTDFRGCIYFARHFLNHHPRRHEIKKII